MTADVGALDRQQGVYTALLAAIAEGATRSWFGQVVADRIPDDVIVPPNTSPFDYLLAIVVQHADRATLDALGDVAGVLLADVLRDHRPPLSPELLRSIARLLQTLHFAPASPNAWRTLLFGYQSGLLDGVSSDGLDIRHLALLAMSAAPPVNALPLSTMLAFFEQELRDRPDYALTAFAGLRQLAPASAIRHVPDLLGALQSVDPPLRAGPPLWELFITLEESERAATTGQVSPAEELGRSLRSRPDIAGLICQTLDRELQAVEDFPNAWAAFQRGLESIPVSGYGGVSFTTRALGPEGVRRATRAADRLSGPLLSARASDRAA